VVAWCTILASVHSLLQKLLLSFLTDSVSIILQSQELFVAMRTTFVSMIFVSMKLYMVYLS